MKKLYVKITDWNGIKGEYEVANIGNYNDYGTVSVTFINSTGDFEKVRVNDSDLFYK